MTILNPEFRDQGVHPGLAAHWELRAFTAKERITGFGPVPYLGWESFGRSWVVWGKLHDVTANMALFGGIGFERFRQGWPVGAYSFEMPVERLVKGPLGAEVTDWLDKPLSWELGEKATAELGANEQESFRIPYYRSLSNAEHISTHFYGLDNVETFNPTDS